jgi:hypothetical protein
MTNPPNPAKSPDTPYTLAVIHPTRTPHNRAATSLPPIAYTDRPYVVKTITPCPIAKIPNINHTASGIPNHLLLPSQTNEEGTLSID